MTGRLATSGGDRGWRQSPKPGSVGSSLATPASAPGNDNRCG